MPPLNVDVADEEVALKYAAAIFVPDSIPPEKVVVPVLLNNCNADQMLACARLISPFIVPFVVTGPFVNVSVAPVLPLFTEVTVPPVPADSE